MSNSKWLDLSIIIFLGLATIGVVIGSAVLAYQDKNIPAALVAIGSVAVGALSGFAARYRL